MTWIERFGDWITRHSVVGIILMLVLTAVFGVGLGNIEQSTSVSGLSGESRVAGAYDQVRSEFTTRQANSTVLLVAVHNESGNVLSKASLQRTLAYQQALQDNETLDATLVDERATISVATIVARAAITAERDRRLCNCTITDWAGTETASREPASKRSPPTLAEQRAQLESMTPREVSRVVDRTLDPSRTSPASRLAARLLPRAYEPGSTNASALLIVVTQETAGDVRAAAAISPAVSEGQQAARAIATSQPDTESYYLYGRGLISPQQRKGMSASLGILGPLALVFVLGSLSVAYRDPVDVVLGLLGVGVVLVWTLGALGWLGIRFTQTMIAVPILLIGLSVDYALQVIMRYRDERAADGPRAAMSRSLGGVGRALVLVTVTTAIGFLANLTSSLGDLRVMGIASALGIVATLCVFGVLVPALKVQVESLLARTGRERTPSPLGSTAMLRGLLDRGATLATRAPGAVLVIALLLTAGGAYGATQVTVATPQESFMADDPPAWTASLPALIEPGEFSLKEDRAFIYERFQAPSKQGYVLLTGNVTAPAVLDSIETARARAAEARVVFDRPDGRPAISTPLSALRRAAAHNESFNATFQAADTDDDGVPDRRLATLYDRVYATTPRLAARTIERTDDGTYTAMRLRIALEGTADRSTAVAPLSDAESAFAETRAVDAIATGQPVISKRLNDGLATTMVRSLGVTLVIVLALLVTTFWLTEGSPSLGAITLLPVICSVTWLLGTMAILDIPIGVVTAVVGSISVGLGVDYAIHISERFAEEFDETVDTRTALGQTLTGTGSALLSSAVTTAAGFGVLSFSLLPALRQFGFVLAVGIVYSFFTSVSVLSSLLALWGRYRLNG